MNYYPKAGRCRHCTKLHEDCSGLPFETMPVHRRDGTDAVVICTEYQQINRNATMKDRRPAIRMPHGERECRAAQRDLPI